MSQKAYSDIQGWQRGKAGWNAGACVERQCAWAGHSPGLWKAFHQRFPQKQSEGRREREVQTTLMAEWKEHWKGCCGEGRKKEGKHRLTCYSHVEAKEGNKKRSEHKSHGLMSWNWGRHIHDKGPMLTIMYRERYEQMMSDITYRKEDICTWEDCRLFFDWHVPLVHKHRKRVSALSTWLDQNMPKLFPIPRNLACKGH